MEVDYFLNEILYRSNQYKYLGVNSHGLEHALHILVERVPFVKQFRCLSSHREVHVQLGFGPVEVMLAASDKAQQHVLI
jgi:hypothetical protein